MVPTLLVIIRDKNVSMATKSTGNQSRRFGCARYVENIQLTTGTKC